MHHGNGTQACLARVLPQVVQYSVSTPLNEGSLRFQTYHPWLDEGDADNIIFGRCASLISIVLIHASLAQALWVSSLHYIPS